MDECAVVVVHGVGDPQPGDALTGFVSAFSVVTGSSLNGPACVAMREDLMHENASTAGVIPMYPVYKLETTSPAIGKSSITRFYEVYWSDLSRLKGSALGLVEGTVDLVFGLRHVVFAAQRELAAATANRFIRIPANAVTLASTAALWLARGPILTLNILGVIASLLYAGFALFPERTLAQIDISLTAVTTGSLITALLGTVLFVTATRSRWSTSTAEAMALLGAGALIAAIVAPDRYRDYQNFAQDLTFGLSIVAGLLAVSILVLLAASVLIHIWLKTSSPCDQNRQLSTQRSLIVINACTILSCALFVFFVFFVMLAWAVIAQQLNINSASQLPKRITEGLHLFGLVWLSFLMIGLLYGGLMLHSWWLKRPPKIRSVYSHALSSIPLL